MPTFATSRNAQPLHTQVLELEGREYLYQGCSDCKLPYDPRVDTLGHMPDFKVVLLCACGQMNFLEPTRKE